MGLRWWAGGLVLWLFWIARSSQGCRQRGMCRGVSARTMPVQSGGAEQSGKHPGDDHASHNVLVCRVGCVLTMHTSPTMCFFCVFCAGYGPLRAQPVRAGQEGQRLRHQLLLRRAPGATLHTLCSLQYAVCSAVMCFRATENRFGSSCTEHGARQWIRGAPREHHIPRAGRQHTAASAHTHPHRHMTC